MQCEECGEWIDFETQADPKDELAEQHRDGCSIAQLLREQS